MLNITTRLKKSLPIIRLVRPNKLSCEDLIYPIFVREDKKNYKIPSIKGERYYSLNDLSDLCSKVIDLRIPALMVFGVVKKKNEDGSVALQKNSFHSKLFQKLKDYAGNDLALISNVCLCDYTTSETCVYTENGKVLNEKSAAMLGKIAVVHAEAGADIVAPAAMVDGQVRHIRLALDEAGYDDIPIMSYVKTDSCLFDPFFHAMTISETPRQGVDSSKFRTDIINHKMFMAKVGLDINEGADIVIVKPALTNLDLIQKIELRYPDIPIAAYQVSGEYAMMEASYEKGYLDRDRILLETLSSIKRAGADMILSYHALVAARLLS
jgi:porphobilinogen synthase